MCLGFSQITLMLPFLLMILHFSQIGLTDDLTFTVKSSFQKKSEYYYIIPLVNLQADFTIFSSDLLRSFLGWFGASAGFAVSSKLCSERSSSLRLGLSLPLELFKVSFAYFELTYLSIRFFLLINRMVKALLLLCHQG